MQLADSNKQKQRRKTAKYISQRYQQKDAKYFKNNEKHKDFLYKEKPKKEEPSSTDKIKPKSAVCSACGRFYTNE